MNPLTPDDFPTFFRALHGCDPYDWQCRLSKRVVEGAWPSAIDLPTGSGKTSCLDIAVFALACQASWPKEQRTAPRRMFFCVNRRVIVDEAYQRARRIAEELIKAEQADNAEHPQTVLGRVASCLRQLSTSQRSIAPPLDVLELRGGIYRDNRWARSATQPTIICSTMDQLGSRFLFRGYGVSPQAAPIQAALIAYESLVLLDEAHISRPFLQTLDFARRYLDPTKWAEQPLRVKPMIVVPMTATPPEGVNDADVIRLEAEDRTNDGLNRRLTASKKAELIAVNDLVSAIVKKATAFAEENPAAVGVIVNRVATAKAVYDELCKDQKKKSGRGAKVELVIGSMRPIDRDEQTTCLENLVGSSRPDVTDETSFIVATQCLEVGADYDFDALVTECASLDALRQRFGRLNRRGRPVEAKAAIILDKKQIKEEIKLDDNKPVDPIYGNALARTWNWLQVHAQVIQENAAISEQDQPKRKTSGAEETRVIDFGIDAFEKMLREHGEGGRIPKTLLAPSALKNAPVMLPAYVDFWCQTSPQPTPDPDVSLFIHGPDAGEPDVQVCWRADLIHDDHLTKNHWCDIVGLLPPTAAECMSVPISRVRRWLANRSNPNDQGDLLEVVEPDDANDGKAKNQKVDRVDPSRIGVLWRGPEESQILESPDQLRPGDTLVLPTQAGGWDVLGHVPNASPETIDVAEFAFRSARDRCVLRLHPILRNQCRASSNLASATPIQDLLDELVERLQDEEEPLTLPELRSLLGRIANEMPTDHKEKLNEIDLREIFKSLADKKLGLLREDYPDNRGVVLMNRHVMKSNQVFFPPETDEGDDDRSRTEREQPITLKDHTDHVRDEVSRIVQALPFDDLGEVYRLAAQWHDLGKADERFQAWLRRTDRTDAWLQVGTNGTLLAKSDGLPQTARQRREARERARLPKGFRHEMLSVQLVEQSDLSKQAADRLELVLHLIAAHHGYARPLAPVVIDDECPEVAVEGVTLTNQQRSNCPPHRVDSGIAERFWNLTRRYGWWGLAYLEAVLRLADQQASANEDEGRFDSANSSNQNELMEAVS